TSYTYQRAIGNSATSTAFVPLRLTPRHRAQMRITANGPNGWSLANTVRYVHRQFVLDNEKGTKLPSYTLWGARLSKKLLEAEIYAAVDNITNKRYAETGTSFSLNPQPGRTYWGGITIHFAD